MKLRKELALGIASVLVIVGLGVYTSNIGHGFVPSATPAPSSIVMSSSRYVRSTPGPTAVRGKSANNLNELTRALLTPVPTATITPFVSGTFQEYINYYYGSASSGQAAPAATSRPSTSSTTYIGNKNTHVFHYASCSSVSQMKSSNKVYIDSRQDAIDSSYRPCQRCHP